MTSRRDFVTTALGTGALAFVAGATEARVRASSPRLHPEGKGASTRPYIAGSAERKLDTINLHALEAEAGKPIPEGPFDCISGGSGDEWTLGENIRSFDDHQKLPRMLAGVTTPDTSITLPGSNVGTPMFIPPMAAHGLAHSSAEKGTARGAAASTALFCTHGRERRARPPRRSKGPAGPATTRNTKGPPCSRR